MNSFVSTVSGQQAKAFTWPVVLLKSLKPLDWHRFPVYCVCPCPTLCLGHCVKGLTRADFQPVYIWMLTLMWSHQSWKGLSLSVPTLHQHHTHLIVCLPCQWTNKHIHEQATLYLGSLFPWNASCLNELTHQSTENSSGILLHIDALAVNGYFLTAIKKAAFCRKVCFKVCFGRMSTLWLITYLQSSKYCNRFGTCSVLFLKVPVSVDHSFEPITSTDSRTDQSVNAPTNYCTATYWLHVIEPWVPKHLCVMSDESLVNMLLVWRIHL